MENKLKNLLKLICFIAITIICLNITGKIFTPKVTKLNGYENNGHTITIKGYYELEPNTIDVLFVGDSSIYKGISPMDIYEQTGITSYNYSTSASRIYTQYYILKDALKTQKPKIVVTDVLTLFYKEKESEEYQRLSFDEMPLSFTKLQMINDDIFDNNFFDKVSYVFPILRYHDRWHELKKEDITYFNIDNHSISKGYNVSPHAKKIKNGKTYMEQKMPDEKMKDYSYEYLIKYIEFCKENDIELILIGMQDARVWNQNKSDTIAKICEEQNVTWLDLNDNRTKINWKKDTVDGGHMNFLGAQKVTKYIAKYLKENYDLRDHRNDKKYKKWNEDLKIWKERKEKYIKDAKSNIKENRKKL